MIARRVVGLSAVMTALAIGSGALAAQGVTETIHVVVTGGPLAGTYDASETKGGCSTGANGPGSWGNAFSNVKATEKEIGALSLIVPSAKAAAAGTQEFYVQLRLGPLMGKNVSYDVETRAGQAKPTGAGLVTVADAGATAKVTITAKTADGVGIQATIDCKTVIRMDR